MTPRPLSVTIIGWLFIAAGTVGLAYHATELNPGRPFENEAVLVCFIRLLALVGGVFILRGRNWARWLLAAWMAYHIVLSALHSWQQLLVHCLLFAVIGALLFGRRATAFFRDAGADSPPRDDQR